MIRRAFAILSVGLLMTTPAWSASTTPTSSLRYSTLPPLPDSIGRGGAFGGVTGGAMLVLGGTNFREKMPWDGGIKSWYHDAFLLQPGANKWQPLPDAITTGCPVAYPVSVTCNDEVIAAGGADATRHYATVTAYKYIGTTITTRALPPLPIPLAYAGGAIAGNTLYVTCGTTDPASLTARSDLFALDLTRESGGWKTLPSLPAESRLVPVVTALGETLYVMGGSHITPGPDGKPARRYLKDAWSYHPSRGWQRLADLPRAANVAPVIPDPARQRIYILGGDDGRHAHLPQSQWPGFARDVLQYDAASNTWTTLPDAPFSTLAAPVIPWQGGHAIISGEIRPGTRSPQIHQVHLPPN